MLKIINRFAIVCLCCLITLIANAELENNVKELIKEDTTEWQLVNINYFPNSLSDSESVYQLSELFNGLLITSNQYQLIFNEKYSIGIKPINDNLIPNFRSLLQKELKRLNLTDHQQENQYFISETLSEQYNLNQSLVFNSDYLFLFINNEIILTFKNKRKMRQELANIYNNLNTAVLPLVDRYWPPEENDSFLPIPDEFNFFLKGIVQDDYLHAIKLKKYKKINLILLFSYSISGAPQLSLISLSEDFDFIDRMELGENVELEDGGIWNKYLIDENFRITIKKIESPYDGYKKTTIFLNQTNYIINENGIFVKLKR
ncbi:hypothetical protein [Gilliamella sp. WF3-4]|uniref:hypothetical protein n=3 Tax=unclassified Gilliamella TaxID=2685620 RepID=UPI00080E4A4D|nr:hypothetical protein [Gilliamella apicola]OCG17301.1 hypothetical protein A9G47_09310 [Gilliamella apicola]